MLHMFCMLNGNIVLNVEVGSHVFIRSSLKQGSKSVVRHGAV
jgi:hypothetical protein